MMLFTMRNARWGVALGIGAVVLLLFLPARRYEILNYDDAAHVLDSVLIRDLSVVGVFRMFSNWSETSYYPLRVLSQALDYRFWGLNPKGYHVTNMVVHAVNALLLFLLLCRLAEGSVARETTSDVGPTHTRNGWVLITAALGALVFGVHPLVVEPVAWVGGREEVLMLLFGLACLHAHMSAMRGSILVARRRGWLAASVLFALFSCMSNVLGATVPVVIWAYDALLVRDSALAWSKWVRATLSRTWPLLLIGVAAVILKIVGNALPHPQRYGSGGIDLGVGERILVILNGYWLNVRNVVWPHHLMLLYPNEVPSTFFRPGVVFGAVLIAGTVGVLWALRRRKAVLFGMVWFLIGLAPSAQVIPHHVFRADRFLYLSMCGVAVIVTAGLRRIRRAAMQRVVLALGVAAVSISAYRAAAHRDNFRNGLVAFGHTVELAPTSWMAQNNLGVALGESDRIEESIYHLSQALGMTPDYPEGHNNIGNALVEREQYMWAVAHYSVALQLRPDYADAHYNLGRAYRRAGRKEQALRHYSEALRLNPADTEARAAIQSMVLQGGQPRTPAQLQAAVRRNPEQAGPRQELADTLSGMGSHDEAVVQYSAALRIEPGNAQIHNNIGIALARLERLAEAHRHYREAIRLDPRSAQAHYNLGNLLAGQEKIDESVVHYSEALRLRPDHPQIYVKLGAAMMMQGRPHEAMQLFSQALALDPGMEEVRRMLDMARRQKGE